LSLGGGFSVKAVGASAQSGHPTAGVIPNGALIEREVPVDLGAGGVLRLLLHQPDFTTAGRLSAAVNDALGRLAAHTTDAGTVTVTLSGESADDAVRTATAIEQVE